MCGFVGIISNQDVAGEVYVALQAIQHRGQDSAGIGTMVEAGNRFNMRRGLGNVVHALKQNDLDGLVGPVGIGHVRYPTIGGGTIDDAQPFFYRQPGVIMAHNGNVTNYEELRDSLLERSIHLLSHCDVEPALCEFADHLVSRRPKDHTLEDALEALREVLKRVRGSFSIVAALMLDGKPTLVVLRDPNGIRPAVVGRRADGSWIAASESVALDVLNYQYEFEPEPGEAIFLRSGEEPIRHSLKQRSSAPCIFEFIYFARPDSVMSKNSVYENRLGFGRALARRFQTKKIEADVVIPIPDTARPAATAMAEELSLPLREGFIKNRYSGRTFIMPDQITRNAALRLKLNPLPREIQGRRVILLDDSIVRGNTLRRVIELVRQVGASEVHLAIHSPPVRNPCFYGIDMSTEEELFARKFEGSLEEIEIKAAEELGADSLTYLDVASMDRVFGKPRCAACFDGVYPQPLTESEMTNIVGDRKEARS